MASLRVTLSEIEDSNFNSENCNQYIQLEHLHCLRTGLLRTGQFSTCVAAKPFNPFQQVPQHHQTSASVILVARPSEELEDHIPKI